MELVIVHGDEYRVLICSLLIAFFVVIALKLIISCCNCNILEVASYSNLNNYNYRGSGGGASQKNWMGVCGPPPKTLTLFMTQICDIPYPICDLTKNPKPYL